MPRHYFVYILTNRHNTVLYTGVTCNLRQRVWQHRNGLGGKFTMRYHVTKLVYFEEFSDPRDAILREKQIKAGSREKKLALIRSLNPEWKDFYEDPSLAISG